MQPLRRLRFIEGTTTSWAASLRAWLQPLRRLRFIGPALLSPGPGPPGPGPGAQWPSSSHREPGCRPSAHGRRLAPRWGGPGAGDPVARAARRSRTDGRTRAAAPPGPLTRGHSPAPAHSSRWKDMVAA